MRPIPGLRPYRGAALLLGFALIIGPGVTLVADQVDNGGAEFGAFGLLLAILNLICRPLANELEAIAFANEQRPWLSGRLKPWQRLVLPYSSALYLTQGLGFGFGGAAYLITASPGWSAFNLLAIIFTAAGGALLWFCISRLFVGLLIIRFSGLWAAPKWAWLTGAATVILVSTLGATWSIWKAMDATSVI
jgi:hypothetical protein